MDSKTIEEALRSRGEAIARLQPDPRWVRAAHARAGQVSQPRGRRRFGALTVGIACLLLGAAGASAATGLLDSALDSFLGGGNPPGRHLGQQAVPSWLQPEPGFNAPDEVSVVASAGDEHLYAYRQRNNICFDYGHHVGECRSPGEWRRELEREPWILRGPVGESTWFGLAGAGVTTVRVEYRDGKPDEVAVTDGGFVVPVDRTRDPRRLLGLDASGAVVVSQSIDS